MGTSASSSNNNGAQSNNTTDGAAASRNSIKLFLPSPLKTSHVKKKSANISPTDSQLPSIPSLNNVDPSSRNIIHKSSSPFSFSQIKLFSHNPSSPNRGESTASIGNVQLSPATTPRDCISPNSSKPTSKLSPAHGGGDVSPPRRFSHSANLRLSPVTTPRDRLSPISSSKHSSKKFFAFDTRSNKSIGNSTKGLILSNKGLLPLDALQSKDNYFSDGTPKSDIHGTSVKANSSVFTISNNFNAVSGDDSDLMNSTSVMSDSSTPSRTSPRPKPNLSLNITELSSKSNKLQLQQVTGRKDLIVEPSGSVQLGNLTLKDNGIIFSHRSNNSDSMSSSSKDNGDCGPSQHSSSGMRKLHRIKGLSSENLIKANLKNHPSSDTAAVDTNATKAAVDHSSPLKPSAAPTGPVTLASSESKSRIVKMSNSKRQQSSVTVVENGQQSYMLSLPQPTGVTFNEGRNAVYVPDNSSSSSGSVDNDSSGDADDALWSVQPRSSIPTTPRLSEKLGLNLSLNGLGITTATRSIHGGGTPGGGLSRKSSLNVEVPSEPSEGNPSPDDIKAYISQNPNFGLSNKHSVDDYNDDDCSDGDHHDINNCRPSESTQGKHRKSLAKSDIPDVEELAAIIQASSSCKYLKPITAKSSKYLIYIVNSRKKVARESRDESDSVGGGVGRHSSSVYGDSSVTVNFSRETIGMEGRESIGSSLGCVTPGASSSSSQVEADTQTEADSTTDAVSSEDFIEVRPLGNGASGTVIEAIHIPTFTLVALKKLPLYNPEKRQQVANELQILYKNLADLSVTAQCLTDWTVSRGSLDTNNVLGFYNAFIDYSSGLVNLVVEYMDSGSLEDLVQDGGCCDERVLADIAYQTLSGLAFLHGNNMIHRDIKPANILCTLTHSHAIVDDDEPAVFSPAAAAAAAAGAADQSRLRADTLDSQRSQQSPLSPRQRSLAVSVKIADFGISKVIEQDSPARTFVGTIVYMSPERITGESAYSYPSDIWSFGLAMLTVADGRFPYSKPAIGSRSKQNQSSQSPVKSGRSNSRSPLRMPPPSSTAAAAGSTDGHSKISPGSRSAAQYNDNWNDLAETENDDDLGDLNGGGFWTMIKAICDDPSPLPGPSYSSAFRDFVQCCLEKDPSQRLTAQQLLGHPFLAEYNEGSSFASAAGASVKQHSAPPPSSAVAHTASASALRNPPTVQTQAKDVKKDPSPNNSYHSNGSASGSNSDTIYDWSPLAVRINQALLRKSWRKQHQSDPSTLFEKIRSLNTLQNSRQLSRSLSRSQSRNDVDVLQAEHLSEAQSDKMFYRLLREIRGIKTAHLELIVSQLLATYTNQVDEFMAQTGVSAGAGEVTSNNCNYFLHSNRNSNVSSANIRSISPTNSERYSHKRLSVTESHSRRSSVSKKYSGRISHLEAECQRVSSLPVESRSSATVDFVANKRRVLLPSFLEQAQSTERSRSNTDKSIGGSSSSSSSTQRRRQQVPGAVKWQHLANQLNLPLTVVQQVVDRMIQENNLGV